MTETAGARSLPCFTGARWLVNAQVPLFAITLGHAGLALSWRAAHRAFGIPPQIGEVLMALAAVAFVVVGLLYALRMAVCPRAVVEDARHPVRMNFFPAISMGLMLLAAGALPYSRALALDLWAVGAVLHLVLCLAIMGRWIRHATTITQASPAWFIPIVGNVLVPIAGVPLGYPGVSWFFFAIGVSFWLPMFAIVLYRLIFHDPLPPRIAPMLFILIAPPAAGFVGYMQLNGGELDVLAHVLAASGIFIALLVLRLAGLYLGLPFSLSWWAYTFPSAALACALIRYQALVGGEVMPLVSMVWLGLATTIIALVTVRTLWAALTGRLFADG